MKPLDGMFLIMFTLKLLACITLSWWVVFSPLIAKVVLKMGMSMLAAKGVKKLMELE